MAVDGSRTVFVRRVQFSLPTRGRKEKKNLFLIRNCETNAPSKRIRIANRRRFCYEFEQLRVCRPVATTFGNLTSTCDSSDRNRRVKFCSDTEGDRCRVVRKRLLKRKRPTVVDPIGRDRTRRTARALRGFNIMHSIRARIIYVRLRTKLTGV